MYIFLSLKLKKDLLIKGMDEILINTNLNYCSFVFKSSPGYNKVEMAKIDKD